MGSSKWKALRDSATHDNVNTALALAGFLLATVTAVSEFLGPSDRFSAFVQSLNLSRPINHASGQFPHWDTKQPTGIIQFVEFEVLLHNESEENISIVRLDQGIFSKNHGVVFDNLQVFPEGSGASSSIYSIPFTIPANEAVRIKLIASLPYDISSGSGNNCIVAGRSFGDVTDCLAAVGRDLAGNSFEIISDGRTMRKVYDGEARSLRIVFRFHAADGTSSDAPATVVY